MDRSTSGYEHAYRCGCEGTRCAGQTTGTAHAVPHTIDCDTRLWGGTTKVRMTTPKGNDLIRGEHLRALIPGSARWKQQYGVRSLAESLNSWFKSFFQRGERVRSKSRLGQWLDLLLLAAWRNTVSLLEYRYRSARNRRATAPPT